MNSTYGQFRRGFGASDAEQASKLVQCRPGAHPGQIICTPVGADGRPVAAPVYDAVKYGRWGRYGGWLGRWGATVSSSSSSKTTSSPSAVISAAPTIAAPTISSSYTASSPSYTTASVSSPSSSYSTSTPSGVVSTYAASNSVVPSYSTTNTVVPTVSSIVQTTGSGDAPYVASSTPASSYFNPSSSSMWNPGGWGPMSAEGQLTMREGEDSPGGYDEDDDDGDDDGESDDGFPNKRHRKRRPGRGYPASRKRRGRARRRRSRRRRNYSGFGMWGAGEILGAGKMGGRSYYKKQGTGGYVYLQFTDDGGIGVDSSSPARKGQYIAPKSSSVWYAITREIGPLAKDRAAVSNYYKKTTGASGAANPTAAIVTSGTAAPEKAKGINALFAMIGGGDKATGQKLVGQAAVQYGPDVATSAQEFLNEKSSSPQAIQKKIDRKKKKLAAAQAKHDKVKVAKLKQEIKGLQARLAEAQAEAAGVIDSTEMPSTSSFPWGYALGGVGLLFAIGLAAKLARG